MNTMEKLRADARSTLFEQLDESRVGMLGVVDSDQHMQPMTHYTDPDTGQLWFITSTDTDLVRAVGLGARAHHCVMSPDGGFYACLSGTLEQSEDREKLDEIWSAVASAWFDEGREDPEVTLLRFALQEAAVWASTDSSVVFGLEVARANLETDHKPDVGEHMIIRIADG